LELEKLIAAFERSPQARHCDSVSYLQRNGCLDVFDKGILYIRLKWIKVEQWSIGSVAK